MAHKVTSVGVYGRDENFTALIAALRWTGNENLVIQEGTTPTHWMMGI